MAGAFCRGLLVIALLTSAPCVFAQALEVRESSGYAEALLPAAGWRQAVVGRQLPAGSVVTAWQDARAKLDYQGDTVEVGPLTHLRVQSLDRSLVRLSLTEGSISIEAAATTFELEYRGIRVSVEKAAAVLSSGTLTVKSGTVFVTEPRAEQRPVTAGSTIELLSRQTGSVFLPTQARH